MQAGDACGRRDVRIVRGNPTWSRWASNALGVCGRWRPLGGMGRDAGSLARRRRPHLHEGDEECDPIAAAMAARERRRIGTLPSPPRRSQRLTRSPLQFWRLAARSRCPCDPSGLHLEGPSEAPAAEIEDAASRAAGWVSRPLPTSMLVRMDPRRKTLTPDDRGRARKG